MNDKYIKNERLKRDIEERLNRDEAKLTLDILKSIEENGKVEPSSIKKIADNILQQRGEN